ncbi:MAG TPA: ABC transporter substrate-binding protein, partial [Thermomicrobiales bacterium]|nr:ABC transporter substrate-binding protein [Thermomicrobiales bacterium]
MHPDRQMLASLLSLQLNRRTTLIGAATAVGAASATTHVVAQDGTPQVSVDATPEGQPGGVLRVGVQGDPTELDPHLVVLDAASLITDLVYEGLVHEDPSLVPQPLLAKSWEISEDGTIYTFALRQGVTFHNGRALVADDVVYSIERVMDPETASPWVSYTDTIQKVEAPDQKTVVFTLSAPDASFL